MLFKKLYTATDRAKFRWISYKYPIVHNRILAVLDALGESNETQHWTISAVDDGYLNREEAKEVWNLCVEVGRMLSSMSDRSDEFCRDAANPRVRESSQDFFCATTLPWED